MLVLCQLGGMCYKTFLPPTLHDPSWKWLNVTKLASRVTKLGNVLRIGQLLQARCYFLEDEAFNVAVGLGCKWLKVTNLTSR